jgi:hypothetical protein
MPRGRAPTPSPSANRMDLVNPTPQPISAVPDQGYGIAGDQQEAQRIAPMSGGGSPTPPSPGGPPQAPPQAGPQDVMAQAAAHNGPGNSLNLMRPTERPNEPVTHGLPVGPGGGPEALTGIGAAARDNAVEQGTLANVLQTMAAQPQAPTAVKALAARAGMGVS